MGIIFSGIRMSAEGIVRSQSINARFVGRRYTTLPGAPAIVKYRTWRWDEDVDRFFGCVIG